MFWRLLIDSVGMSESLELGKLLGFNRDFQYGFQLGNQDEPTSRLYRFTPMTMYGVSTSRSGYIRP